MAFLGASLDWLARRPGRAFLIIFGLSFAVQGFFLTKVDERHVRPNTRWEVQAVAFSLAETGRFADPYALPTGPTAHVAPIPPAISALIFKVFGLTRAGGYADWLLRMVVSAAVWGILPWLAGRVGLGARAGLIAGVVGALFPSWPSHGTALTALAMGLLTVAFLERWSGRGRGWRSVILVGLACGAACHIQPVLLSVVCGWILFELAWNGTRPKSASTALIALGFVLACLPWAWRNYRTFDAVFFIRSNLGLELRMGHHQGATAAMFQMDGPGELLHPRLLESEAKKVQEWGEITYMRRAGGEALDWIRTHPLSSAKLVGARVALWWLGPFRDPPMAVFITLLSALAVVGAWRSWSALSVPQRAAVLMPLLTYPLIYYVVAYMPAYRGPINWLYLLLAAAAVDSWLD